MRDGISNPLVANGRGPHLDADGRRLELRRLIATLPPETRPRLHDVASAVDGWGPLSELVSTEGVTDVLVNGPDEVWVERHGALQRTEVRFASAEAVLALARALLTPIGGRVDFSHPIADAFLPHMRVHVVIPPVVDVPILSIRRFESERPSLEELTQAGGLSEGQDERLRRLVSGRATVLIAGATGSGKTTLLNALLGLVPADERVVVLEETPELRPACSHWVALRTKVANQEGRGALELADLVRAALRMRPDRIVVGEVRGTEAAAALDALETGHLGSMLTVHARSAAEALERVAALAARGSGGVGHAETLRRVTSVFDAVVCLERVGSVRRVADIREP